MANDVEGKFDPSGVHPWVKYGLPILTIPIIIESFVSGGNLIGIVALAIAFFFAGPQCVKWAKEGKLNQTWAYFIGVIFILLGVLIYWIYFKVKGGSRL